MHLSYKSPILGCSIIVLILLLSCSAKADKPLLESIDEPIESVTNVAFEFRSEIDSDSYMEKRFVQLKKVHKNDTLIYKYYTDSIVLESDSMIESTASGGLEDNCLVFKIYNNMRVLRTEEFQASLKGLDTRVNYVLRKSFNCLVDSNDFKIYHYTTSDIVDNGINLKEDLYFSIELGWIASFPKVNQLACVVISNSNEASEEALNEIVMKIGEQRKK